MTPSERSRPAPRARLFHLAPDGPVVAATLRFDGASRGNPGPAAYGYVLSVDGEEHRDADGIGRATNNEAEYRALLAGLRAAVDRDVSTLRVYGDSELVVKQLRGEYRVNAENLRPLYEEVTSLLSRVDDWSVEHVDREQNATADDLANEALDEA